MAGLHVSTDQCSVHLVGILPCCKLPVVSLVPLIRLIWRGFFAMGRAAAFPALSGGTGQQTSIFGAHRLDNEIDVGAGIRSTIAAFIAMGRGASVGPTWPVGAFWGDDRHLYPSNFR